MLELKSKCSYQWNKLTWFGNLLIEGGKTIFAKFKLLAYITACGLFCFLVYRLETEEQAIKLLAVMIKQVNASYEE